MEINQLVTRISHKHDVVFRVVNIVNGIATLRGEVIRLICDAPLNDLKTFEEKGDSVISFPSLRQASFTRNEVLKGKVLHIDGDEYYLQKAVEAYRQYGIPAVGYFIDENEMPKRVLALLKKHQPNILVITGHDAIEGKGHDLTNIDSYRNSKFFAQCVEIARSYQPNKDDLVIIAGACQSYYEYLIKSGANFASSPMRENIHLLDPVIVAAHVATTYIYDFVMVDRVLENTISHGIGGIDTRGSMRRLYIGRPL